MGTNGLQRPAVDYSGLHRKRKDQRKNRKLFFFAFFLVLALLLFVLMCRFSIESFFVGKEKSVENAQSLVSGSLEMRKNIYDRNLENMAVGFQLVSIYARPLELENIRKAADRLAPVLGCDADKLYEDLKMEKSYEWLAKHVSPALAAEVADLDLPGVYFSYENERFYPHNSLGAHVLGFVNDEQGLAGIESYYDTRLRSGIARELVAGGRDISPGEASRPGHLVLTLDLKIQAQLEDDLQKLAQQVKAERAMAALMEIDGGAIVALANLPAFDPNAFWKSSPESLVNRVVSERIKPGPLNRLFMSAADIRDGRISWEEPTAEAKPFPDKELQPRIRKKRVKGPLSMQWHGFSSEFLGTLELADIDSRTPPDALAALAVSLGFDKARQLDLAPARIKGINYEEKVKGDGGSYLFADDNSVTALSLLTGFTWLVNGGHQVKPYLLRETITNDGRRESLSHPYGRVPGFSGEMSRRFVSFLADKVKPGHKFYIAESLALEEGEIVGLSPEKDNLDKAETAVPRFQTVLLGMGPVSNPRLSIVVVLDGAEVDLTSCPPGRRLLNKLMDQAVSRLSSAEVKEGGLPPQLDNEEIYHRWLTAHDSPDTVLDKVGNSPDRMPDLRGYSLRRALQILQPVKMRITVHGAGRVSGQKPRPGVEIKGDECVLTLSMDS